MFRRESRETTSNDLREALVLLREVTTNPLGSNQHSNNVTTLESERGNSKAYSLDKLKRDRPDKRIIEAV